MKPEVLAGTLDELLVATNMPSAMMSASWWVYGEEIAMALGITLPDLLPEHSDPLARLGAALKLWRSLDEEARQKLRRLFVDLSDSGRPGLPDAPGPGGSVNRVVVGRRADDIWERLWADVVRFEDGAWRSNDGLIFAGRRSVCGDLLVLWSTPIPEEALPGAMDVVR